MMLDREKLRQTLAELHVQLDEAESLDAELAAQLRGAADEISQKLDQHSSTAAADGDELEETSTAEGLEEAAIEFEQSHPTIAGTVRRLIDMLAQMGI